MRTLLIIGCLIFICHKSSLARRIPNPTTLRPEYIDIRLETNQTVERIVAPGTKVLIKCPFDRPMWFINDQVIPNQKRTKGVRLEIRKGDSGSYGCQAEEDWAKVTLKVESEEELFENSGLDEAETYDVLADAKLPFWKRESELYKAVTKNRGSTFRLRCVAGGEPKPGVTFTKDNNTISDPKVQFSRWYIQIDELSVEDAGTYTCLVCNQIGCISHSTKLTINERFSRNLDVKSFPADLKAENLQLTDVAEVPENSGLDDTETYGIERKEPTAPMWRKESELHNLIYKPSGNMFRFRCPAEGFPEPNVTWTKNNETIVRSMGKVKNSKWAIILEELIPSDSGYYTCKVCNIQGCIEHTTRLEVQDRYPARPVIMDGSVRNVTLLVNDTAEFTCVTISDLAAHISWYRGQVENGTDVATIPEGRKLKHDMDSPETLKIENVTYEDEGWYSCVAVNSLGDSTSSGYLRVVDELPDPVLQPIVQNPPLHFVAIGLGVVCVIFVGGFTCMLKKVRRAKMKQRIMSERVNQWTKKVIIIKSYENNNSEHSGDTIQMPIVRIEKQRTTLGSGSNESGMISEYEFPIDLNWEFPRSQLFLGEKLGEGAFGKVFKAEAKGLIKAGISTTVAVKMLKEGHTDEEVKDLVSEMEVMKILGNHINVLKLLGTCSQEGPLYVIEEYAHHGNLRDFLRKNRPVIQRYQNPEVSEQPEKNLTQKDLVSYAFQVARGMEYLASRRYIHRDLAARNVLVSEDYVMKIADFGLARDIHSQDYYRKTTDGRLPIKWMAPESLFDKVYDTQSDVWAYGILLWEIMTMGATPYPSVPCVRNLLDLLKKGERMSKPDHCSIDIYMLMRECWNFEANERPTFSEIVQQLDRTLTETADEEYLNFSPIQVLETPPSSDDESEDDETVQLPFLL